jgi:hypothetical protein
MALSLGCGRNEKRAHVTTGNWQKHQDTDWNGTLKKSPGSGRDTGCKLTIQ